MPKRSLYFTSAAWVRRREPLTRIRAAHCVQGRDIRRKLVVSDSNTGGGANSAVAVAEKAEETAPIDIEALERETDIAADYIEGLLDIADFDGDIDMDVEGDRPLVSVVGVTIKELVGERGEVLEALQELTRLAVHRVTGTRSRLMLDIGGYRESRRKVLRKLGAEVAREVKRTGKPKKLTPMTPFERKVVHDAVAAAGLHSESEGEEPNRCVVVYPVD